MSSSIWFCSEGTSNMALSGSICDTMNIKGASNYYKKYICWSHVTWLSWWWRTHSIPRSRFYETNSLCFSIYNTSESHGQKTNSATIKTLYSSSYHSPLTWDQTRLKINSDFFTACCRWILNTTVCHSFSIWWHTPPHPKHDYCSKAGYVHLTCTMDKKQKWRPHKWAKTIKQILLLVMNAKTPKCFV